MFQIYTRSIAEGSVNILYRNGQYDDRKRADASAYTFNATMHTTLDNIVAFLQCIPRQISGAIWRMTNNRNY